jgi:hypothetical protein
MKCDSCLRGAGHDTGKVIICISLISFWGGGCRGRVVVGFTTTYAISAYHH